MGIRAFALGSAVLIAASGSAAAGEIVIDDFSTGFSAADDFGGTAVAGILATFGFGTGGLNGVDISFGGLSATAIPLPTGSAMASLGLLIVGTHRRRG